ncbi:peptidoglycan endopeptidase [Luteimonas terrae]|uniref:Peptidoglycan endopeptidase n=2 Tax=Luteimonas terrae TaxID=1530191 RepID=A0A4R5UF99_9GAMM|nr:peptidoglycan endopeptidase [Luteimonas terrae]
MLLASDINQLIAMDVDKPVQADGRVEGLLKRALTLIGTPYRWGGSSPDSGFDCSGLVGYVFRTALGIDLPRVSRDMAQNGERVERTALTAGDLVFFGRRGNRIDHVGIYLGDGRFVHAPRTGKDVMVSELDTGYWATRFKSARRVAGV